MRFFTKMLVAATLLSSTVAGNASAQLSEVVVTPVANLELDDYLEVDDQPDESTDASLLAQLAGYEARLQMLEANLERPVAQSCKNSLVSSTRIFTNGVGCSTTYAGYEMLVMKPHVGGLQFSLTPIPVVGQITGTFDYDIASRVFLGHEMANGLGIRASYFTLGDTSNRSDLGIATRVEIQSFDLEATNRTRFAGTELLVSGGVRYGLLKQDFEQALIWESEGAGLTLSAMLIKDLGRTNFDVFAGGRGSILLTSNEIGVGGLFLVENEESTMTVLEARLGLRHSYQFANGVSLASEISIETQNWDSAAIAGIIGNEISLVGPAFRWTLAF